MLTPFRQAPVRFTNLATILCFLAVGSFDTLKAQSLTVSSTNLVFTAAQGANPIPVSQTVNVGSTGANLIYNITLSPSGSWLSASAQTGFGGSSSGTTPDQINVQVNSTSLPSGSYSGTVTLTPTVGTAVTISVGLTITGGGNTTSFLSAAPSQLSFAYELHQAAPPSQTTLITSSGISLTGVGLSINTAPTSNCPSGWFQASLSSTSTPATLTVSIVTTGLGAGSCTGAITVSSNTPTNGTTTTLIGVTLFVSSSALLNITIPSGLQSVTLQQGVRPVQFSTTNNPPNPLVLTSSDPNQQLTFTITETTNAGFNWLSVAPSSNTTPANVNIQITPGSVLAVGTYTGTITITSAGLLNNTTSIPITLNITSASSVSISNTTPTFTGQQLGSVPASQTLTLTGPAAQSPTFTTSVIQQSGGAWLQISPSSGSLTATPTSSTAPIILSINPNIFSTLSPGTYSSEAVITFANSAIPAIILTVSLTVQSPSAALVVTPSAVTFTYQAGGAVPSAQTVTISNPASGSLPFTVASVSDSWFSVSPSGGNTPGSLSVSVSPQSLQPGSYNGSFTLTASGVPNTTVNVALFISASTAPQPFIIANNSSGTGGQLAPGEIIYIKGSGLGPGNSQTGFTTNLGGVQVTFNGVPGTLIYVSSTQLDVVVPYEVAGSTSATIVVTYQNLQSAGIVQPVGAVSFGLSTNNQAGTGQVAALNPANSCGAPPCYNTPATPVLQGSYISVYGTGGGQTNPASTDGEISSTATLLPLALEQSITATIGGKPATILFAGAAPGEITGVVQLNIQVPTGVSGILPILVTINGLQSQAGATVAVQ